VKYRPLKDTVLIRRHEAAATSKGGVLLPDAAIEKPMLGTVVAVGPGDWDWDTNRRLPMSVAVGDVVVIPRFAGNDMPGEPDLVFVGESDLICVVEPATAK